MFTSKHNVKRHVNYLEFILLDYLKSRNDDFSVNDIIKILDELKENISNMSISRLEGVGKGGVDKFKEYV